MSNIYDFTVKSKIDYDMTPPRYESGVELYEISEVDELNDNLHKILDFVINKGLSDNKIKVLDTEYDLGYSTNGGNISLYFKVKSDLDEKEFAKVLKNIEKNIEKEEPLTSSISSQDWDIDVRDEDSVKGSVNYNTIDLVGQLSDISIQDIEKDTEKMTEAKEDNKPQWFTIMFFHNGDTYTGILYAPNEQRAREKFAKYCPSCKIDRIKRGILGSEYPIITHDFEYNMGWKDEIFDESFM